MQKKKNNGTVSRTNGYYFSFSFINVMGFYPFKITSILMQNVRQPTKFHLPSWTWSRLPWANYRNLLHPLLIWSLSVIIAYILTTTNLIESVGDGSSMVCHHCVTGALNGTLYNYSIPLRCISCLEAVLWAVRGRQMGPSLFPDVILPSIIMIAERQFDNGMAIRKIS